MSSLLNQKTIGDFSEERLLEQQAVADALRKQGMAGNGGAGYHGGKVFIVGNQLGNLASALAGTYLGNKTMNERQALQDTRDQQYADAMAQMPSATEQREVWTPAQMAAGPTQEAPVMQAMPKSARQLQQENTKWVAGLPNIPQFQALKQAGMLQALTAPEKQAAQEEAAAERKEARLEKAEEAFRLQVQRDEDNRRRDRERAEDKKDYARFAAFLRPAPAERNVQTITTDQGILERQSDGSWVPIKVGDKVAGKPFAPTGGGKGGKLTPEQQQTFEVESLDDLIRRTDELRKAKGLQTVTGSVAGALPGAVYSLNPDARSAVSTYDKYMEYLQTEGLQDLKKRGVSPGSVTEKEWPKFVARKTSLDRVKDMSEVTGELDRIKTHALNTRAKVLGTGDTYHQADGKIYRLPAGANSKVKSSYEEVQ